MYIVKYVFEKSGFCIICFIESSNLNGDLKMLCQKQSPGGVLKNLQNRKIHRKHLRQSLFLNKIAGHRAETLLKRDSGTGVFL